MSNGYGVNNSIYRVLHEWSARQYQQIVLEKTKNKNFLSSWLPFLKLKGLLAPEISKFTKICIFKKKIIYQFEVTK